MIEGNVITSWAVFPELSDNTIYYWRARADDGDLTSSWTRTAMFSVNTSGGSTEVKIEASKLVSATAADTQIVEVTNQGSPISGAAIEVPAGALAEDCTMTIGLVTNPPALPDTTKALNRVIEFGPHGLTFSIPVTIKIPYTQQDLDDANINDPNQLEVFTYNTNSLSWQTIPIGEVGTINKQLLCFIDHFSMYTLGASIPATPSNNPSNSGGGGGRGCFIDSLF